MTNEELASLEPIITQAWDHCDQQVCRRHQALPFLSLYSLPFPMPCKIHPSFIHSHLFDIGLLYPLFHHGFSYVFVLRLTASLALNALSVHATLSADKCFPPPPYLPHTRPRAPSRLTVALGRHPGGHGIFQHSGRDPTP